MKLATFLIISLAAAILFGGCASDIMTREEYDVYSRVIRDTTFKFDSRNLPGNRDNGVIYPSSRVFTLERRTLIQDSLVMREYPNFIRLGVFESVGLMAAGDRDNSLGVGILGIFPDLNDWRPDYRGDSSKLFPGGIYRIGIGEWRLRWFRDAKNWTWGTSIIEFIAPDARLENTLISLFPIYVRKRFYLREEIPYIALTPGVGFGWFPSQYVNFTGSIDVGSIGGFNLRAYLGLAAGVNMDGSYQINHSDYTNESETSVFPYFGLGISFLDFLNLVPETEEEWKYYEHSSWNVGLMQFGLLSGATKSSIYSPGDAEEEPFLTGLSMRLLHGEVAIPYFNNRLYAGTSLFNILVLGKTDWGMGILPLRVGYWQPVIEDELTAEPFVEFNYYPSSFVHFGGKLNLRISELVNFGIIAGYASGSNDHFFGEDLTDTFGSATDISGGYIGVSLGIADRIFFPQHLRYNK